MTPPVIQRWIDVVESGRADELDELLAEDAVFYSPAVFTPQEGRAKTAAYLKAAAKLFGGSDFRYVGQWYGERSAILEFTTDIDGIHVNGVDMIAWNDDEPDRLVQGDAATVQGACRPSSRRWPSCCSSPDAATADRRYPCPEAGTRPARPGVGRGLAAPTWCYTPATGWNRRCSTRWRPGPSGSSHAGATTTAPSCARACPNAPTRPWAVCASRSCTRPAPPTAARRGWRKQYPDTDVLVFGHSHIPWDTTAKTGLRLLNPGSPTDRRRQPFCTYMTATVEDAALTDVVLHRIDRNA